MNQTTDTNGVTTRTNTVLSGCITVLLIWLTAFAFGILVGKCL